MLTPEAFAEIATRAEAGEAATAEETAALVQALRRTDFLLVVFQNALELTASNAYDLMPDLANSIMERCGRTDQKSKKSIAEMAAKAVATIDGSVQGYLTSALMQGAEVLGLTLEELLGVKLEEVADETTLSSSSEEPQA